MTKHEKVEKQEKEQKIPVEKYVLDHLDNRFTMVAKAILRSRELVKNNPEHKNLQEIIVQSVEDVYGNKTA